MVSEKVSVDRTNQGRCDHHQVEEVDDSDLSLFGGAATLLNAQVDYSVQ